MWVLGETKPKLRCEEECVARDQDQEVMGDSVSIDVRVNLRKSGQECK
jgi:hypothetical protein